MGNAIVWFRNDLRLADHPALQAALEAGHAPVCVYLHDPQEEGEWAPGAASDAWRHRSLVALDADLRTRGARLRCFAGPALPTLQALAASFGAEAVYWNRRYEPAIERRDTRIKQALRRDGLEVRSFNGSLLSEPWDVATQDGGPYRVFTPYWRKASAEGRWPSLSAAPERLPDPVEGPDGVSIAALRLAPPRGWDASFWDHWQPGEAGAQAALDTFLEGALHGYGTQRDLPDRVGSSRLSPHLHFGEIAPWRVAGAVAQAADGSAGRDASAFLRQLGWRDFAHHLMHHFPQSVSHDLTGALSGFRWAQLPARTLGAWQRGATGIPIVDAGMRELWRTGWMHNRVRMLVASLLTKQLRVHWLAGARWFWDTLVDADLANNTLGWQWVAGTGADAAPYFRIFNPVTQAEKFDPQARYILRWLPELAALPPPLRFAPWRDPASVRRLAPGYPERPIVDLALGREQALAAYREARSRVARPV